MGAARGFLLESTDSPAHCKVFPMSAAVTVPRTPQAVRHHGAAVRERPVPHRPHHGVHPGRHLGALPADAGPRRAFRLRRRRARRADHAEGGGRRRDAAGARRAHRGDAAEDPRRLPHQLRPLALDRLAGERRAVAGHLPPAEGQGPRSTRSRSSSSTTRSRRCSCPTATSRARARSAARRTSTATPARTAARSTRRPTSSIPYSTLTGARPELRSRPSTFFRLSDPPRASRSCATGRAAGTGPALQPEVLNKIQEWLGDDDGKALDRLGHLARRALLRHPDPRRARQVFLRLARCAGRLPREPQGASCARQRRSTSRNSCRIPDVEQYPLHRQGHRVFPHAVLAGDARSSPARLQEPDQRVRARLPDGARARRCRSRAAPASARTATSTSASTPSGCATTSPPS